jgi:EmrB/QacA subfamily drug resistance transporter
LDAPLSPRLRLLIPVIVALAFLMDQLDSTIITTAVPEMARSLNVTPIQLNLAVTAYVLTLAVFIPLSGYLADRFGARRVFISALTIFTIGSGLCGFATSFPMLIAMRVVQGLGGAMMTPVGRLILIRSFPRSELVTAMTYMTLPALLGPLLGPLMGGLLTTYLSWRWIFYVNLPFGLIGVLLALRFIKDRAADPKLKFDFIGFLMIGSGLALFQVGMDNIGQPALSALAIATIMGAAVVLLACFATYALRVPHPVMNLRLFRYRLFSVGTLAGGIARVSINGTPFLLPLMLQVGFGMSPVTSGSLVLFASAGALFVRSFIARALRRLGFGRVLTGATLAGTLIIAGFGLMTPATPHCVIAVYVFVYGLIRSIQFMGSNMLSYSEMPDKNLSQATSLFGVFQQLTVSVGVSLSAMLLSLISNHGTNLSPGNFHIVFFITASLSLFALPSYLSLKPEDGAFVSGYQRAGLAPAAAGDSAD